MGLDDRSPAPSPPPEQREIDILRARIDELERLVLATNDAACGLAGILCRVVVDEGAVGRDVLADAIEERAGSVESDDHNPILRAFARSIRMNFPGGRFEVIDGGRMSEFEGGTD